MITPSFGLTATERVLPRLALDWTTGSAQSGVDVTRAGVATFIGSNGLVQSATADTQRIDYSTGTAGLLVEESRTNLCLYSEDLRNTAEAGVTRPWVHINASITYQPAGVTSPDGNENVCTLVENTATSSHYTYQVIASADSNFTYSIFAKDAGRRYLRMMIADTGFTGGSRAYAVFDLQTGASAINGITTSNLATKAETLSDGWYKCSVTATITAGSPMLVGLFLSNVYSASSTLPSYEGDGVSGIHLYGADNQVGLFPTSYIPTEAAAVTRNADLPAMTGTNFSDWYNQTEGSFYADFAAVATTGQRIITLYKTATTNELRFIFSNGAGNGVRVDFVTSGVFIPANITPASFRKYKLVSAMKEDSFAVCRDGGAVATASSGLIPEFDQMIVGENLKNGYIHKIMYWPQRLTNNEVQAFSK
jgi:hypothetical protein